MILIKNQANLHRIFSQGETESMQFEFERM